MLRLFPLLVDLAGCTYFNVVNVTSSFGVQPAGGHRLSQDAMLSVTAGMDFTSLGNLNEFPVTVTSGGHEFQCHVPGAEDPTNFDMPRHVVHKTLDRVRRRLRGSTLQLKSWATQLRATDIEFSFNSTVVTYVSELLPPDDAEETPLDEATGEVLWQEVRQLDTKMVAGRAASPGSHCCDAVEGQMHEGWYLEGVYNGGDPCMDPTLDAGFGFVPGTGHRARVQFRIMCPTSEEHSLDFRYFAMGSCEHMLDIYVPEVCRLQEYYQDKTTQSIICFGDQDRPEANPMFVPYRRDPSTTQA
eukprot:gene2915-3500_t